MWSGYNDFINIEIRDGKPNIKRVKIQKNINNILFMVDKQKQKTRIKTCKLMKTLR